MQSAEPVGSSRTTRFAGVFVGVGLGVLLLLFSANSVHAQTPPRAPKVLSTKRPYVVMKVYRDAKTPDEEVADFDKIESSING